MTRRFYYTIEFITAGILVSTALSLLLIPNRQILLNNQALKSFTTEIAICFFLVSLFSLTALFTGASGRMRQVTEVVRTATILTLSLFYLFGNLPVEALAVAGIAVSHPLSIKISKIQSSRPSLPLIMALSVVNIGAGLLMIFGPTSWLVNYHPVGVFLIPIGIASLLTGLAGCVALIWPDLPIDPYLEKLLVLPWLFWSIAFVIHFQVSILIPSIFLLASFLFANRLVWERLIPPKPNSISRQLIPILGIIYAAIIVFVSLQLNSIEFLSRDPQIINFVEKERDAAFTLICILTIILGHLIGVINLSTQNNSVEATSGTNANHNIAQIAESNDQEENTLEQTSQPDKDEQATQNILKARFRHLNTQLEIEKRRTAQLNLLQELRHQLYNQYDEPVIAQLAVNVLQRTFNCSLAAILLYDNETRELVSMAAAGPGVYAVPAGYRQSANQGIIGRASRLRKTQIANNTRLDPDFFQLEKQSVQSEVVVPILNQGHLKGVLLVDDEKPMAFSSIDVATIEAVAAEVVQAWELGSYQHRLMELIHAGVSLSTMMEPQASIREIAIIARQTLDARFVFVMLVDRENQFSRTASAGFAPNLMKTLSANPVDHPLIAAALNAASVFRVRDVRKYEQNAHLPLDHKRLQSFIGIPIRLHRMSIGTILAFGKKDSLFFSKGDESLANLLSYQAAAAVESSWLYNKLRAATTTATLLYQLSFNIIQKDEMSEKAEVIASTARRITQAQRTGIVLFDTKNDPITSMVIDDDGMHSEEAYPTHIIQQAVETNQWIILAGSENLLNVCIPLFTTSRKHGALWFEITEELWLKSQQDEGLQTMTNQVAVALERASLLIESQQQAKELEKAYRELEITYDQTLTALMSALDARDRETEGHSGRVGKAAARLGKMIGLPPSDLKILERGSLLHDIGKIGIEDAILKKPGPLTDQEWEMMRKHPDIGANIVDGIPFLEDTLSIIRYHQERWNGSGYPLGLAGKEIPLLARIFAVVDALDALTSVRPYRQKVSVTEALGYLQSEAGTLFDPHIVEALTKLVDTGEMDDLIQ